MPHKKRCENADQAFHDLQLAILCVRELIRQRRVGREVWATAWEWQQQAHTRWMQALARAERHALISAQPTPQQSDLPTSSADLVRWLNEGG
jgi:hypothetical protein